MPKDINKKRVGIVGCGDVSHLYMKNISKQESIDVVFCFDQDSQNKMSFSKKYNVNSINSFDDIFKQDIDCVLLLTPPKTRYELISIFLDNNLSVYTEKPLSINFKLTNKLYKKAKKNRVLLGCAPDVFLSKWLFVTKEILSNNELGDVMSAHCLLLSDGPELWHPRPSFFYGIGGGPILDRSIYYISALVELFGEVESVKSISKKNTKERKAELTGENFPVLVDTHYHFILDFKKGPTVSCIASFDIKTTENDHDFKIFGSKNTLKLPNPMDYSNYVEVWDQENKKWKKMFGTKGVSTTEEARGFGFIDMLDNINNVEYVNNNLRKNWYIHYIMHSIEKSSKKGKTVFTNKKI